MINRIKIAQKEDFSQIYSFYREVCEALKDAKYTPYWKIGVYPGEKDLMEHIRKQEMVLGYQREELAAVMAVEQHEEYSSLHLLAVSPRFRGNHLAEEMLRIAVETAIRRGHSSLLLDVVKGNLPAERLYEKFGFQKMGERTEYFEFAGEIVFCVYKYVIEEEQLS